MKQNQDSAHPHQAGDLAVVTAGENRGSAVIVISEDLDGDDESPVVVWLNNKPGTIRRKFLRMIQSAFEAEAP